jgi:hypothetical protein
MIRKFILKHYVLPELQAIMKKHNELEAKGVPSIPLLIVANRIEEIKRMKLFKKTSQGITPSDGSTRYSKYADPRFKIEDK